MEQKQQKVWTRESVLQLLDRNDEAVAKALWELYQRQTADEQSALQTKHHNGVGFNGRDAEFLSDVARRLPRYRFNMTPKQTAAVRKRIKKYVGQLLDVIEAKGGVVDRKRTKGETAKPPISETAAPQAAAQPELWGAYA